MEKFIRQHCTEHEHDNERHRRFKDKPIRGFVAGYE